MSQGRADGEPPPPAPAHRGILLGFALATLALHLAVLTRYGWFRDELYYVVCARRLAWGYVDHPPLSIALLALVRLLCGESLAALRLVPALAGAATVALTGLLAARLGGGRFAQALACCTALLAPVLLGITRFYSMNAFDLLFWTLAGLAMVGIVRQGSPRQWVALGVVLGLGLLNKISVSWLGAGVAAALALTRERRWLLTPWPYLAALVAAALFLPHLLWQVAHGWPTLEFMRNATGRKMVEVSVVDFWARQLMSAGPANALVWLPGLGFALLARSARAWRPLAIVYLTAAGILMLGGSSRASYLAVAYPMLLALGGMAWESFTAGRVSLRAALLAIVVLLGLVPVPFALPVLPVEGFIRYQAALGMAPETEERHAMGPLPQHYADMFGWEELVAAVARAHRGLSPAERERAVVFGQNYGEAGAVDVLGRRLSMPRALSGHNSYWLWGPGAWDGSVMIVIDDQDGDGPALFERWERVGSFDHPYAMPYERRQNVYVGRGFRQDPVKAWAGFKSYN